MIEYIVTIHGSSMLPLIRHGDVLSVSSKTKYQLGDIVLFEYKGEHLVHRIVNITSNKYICKGDNSFRLEDIYFDEIKGSVEKINGIIAQSLSNGTIELSYLVGLTFRGFGYDKLKTINSEIYKRYLQSISTDCKKT